MPRYVWNLPNNLHNASPCSGPIMYATRETHFSQHQHRITGYVYHRAGARGSGDGIGLCSATPLAPPNNGHLVPWYLAGLGIRPVRHSAIAQGGLCLRSRVRLRLHDHRPIWTRALFISASFAPSLFGWNRKVYSGRREADVVIESAIKQRLDITQEFRWRHSDSRMAHHY
jgi:hypothetical protein